VEGARLSLAAREGALRAVAAARQGARGVAALARFPSHAVAAGVSAARRDEYRKEAEQAGHEEGDGEKPAFTRIAHLSFSRLKKGCRMGRRAKPSARRHRSLQPACHVRAPSGSQVRDAREEAQDRLEIVRIVARWSPAGRARQAVVASRIANVRPHLRETE